MKLGLNKVLVKPDSDYTSVSGFDLPLGEDQKHVRVTGVIVATGKFRNKRSEKLLSDRMGKLIKMNWTMQSDGADLKAGDKVVFSFSVRYDCPMIDGCILMSCDRIYGRERDGVFKTIHDWELIQMLEKEDVEEVIPGLYQQNFDKNDYGTGIVRYGSFKNKIVFFDKRHTARLELDYHNTMSNGQSSLFKLDKKHVLCWISAS